jgi:FkbM family methyltransferase
VKQHLKRIVSAFGYDLRRLEPERDLINFIRSQRVMLVLDVGANIGQFAMHLRDNGYSGKIISFEPIGDVFAELAKNAERDGNWSAVNVGLGRAEGTSLINVSNETVFSSILQQTDYATASYPGARPIRQESIKMMRLDDVFEHHDGVVLLKIDTQGFESAVLDGATKALRSINAVWLELPIVHLYQGVWSLEDAVAYMDARGFMLSQIKPVNSNWDDPVIEVDCLFRRRADQTID